MCLEQYNTKKAFAQIGAGYDAVSSPLSNDVDHDGQNAARALDRRQFRV